MGFGGQRLTQYLKQNTRYLKNKQKMMWKPTLLLQCFQLPVTVRSLLLQQQICFCLKGIAAGFRIVEKYQHFVLPLEILTEKASNSYEKAYFLCLDILEHHKLSLIQ